MPITHFPYGVSSYGMPVVPSGTIPIGVGGPGNTTADASSSKAGPGSQVFFVNSAVGNASDVAGRGLDPLTPFKSINFAVTRCIANNGDVIYAGPQHVESIVAAGSLTLGKAGVTIIGIGSDTDRPTLAFSALASATCLITAANVTLANFNITNAIDALVVAFVPTAANFHMVNCSYRDLAATNTLIQIKGAATATGMQLLGYHYYEDQTGGGTQKTEAIRLVGGDSYVFADCIIEGNYTTGLFNNITTLFTNATWIRCALNQLASSPCLTVLTTSTGYLIDTMLGYAATRAITASHAIAADMASGQCIPGGTPAVIAHA